MNRKALTLMEMLLAIAVLAIIAAVGAPSFFMNAGEKLSQARMAMCKARYVNLRTAIDLHLKDELVLDNDYRISSPDSVTPVRKLIEAGYLQPASAGFESKAGNTLYFSIQKVASPLTSQLPPILRVPAEYHVLVQPAGYDIDHALRVDKKSWSQIWREINGESAAPPFTIL
jgi:prepilin-type N-terminal cleavage/methylation domain-containing protein